MFIITHTATTVYERMSTRSLAKLVRPADAATAKFYFWDASKMSFDYYTGAERVKRFRHAHRGDLEKLVKLLTSEQSVYCLVTGGERLADLNRACPGGFRILGRSGDRWLVTNHRHPG